MLKVHIVVVLLFTSVPGLTQTENDSSICKVVSTFRFELGLRDEISMMKSVSSGGPYALNPHLVLGFRTSQSFKISGKIGLLQLNSDYIGYDVAFLLEERIWNIAALGGITFLEMSETAHSIYNINNGTGRGIILGVGYYGNDHFIMDVTYYFPLGNSVYGHYTGIRGGTYEMVNKGFWCISLQVNIFSTSHDYD